MLDLKEFIDNQLSCWPLAKANYDNLEQAIFKDVYLSESERIRLVCLPARIASSSARITAKGQVDRPCFLCSHRLPSEQKALDYGDFHILVNPFPVFTQHFTLPSKQHRRQAILPVKEVFFQVLQDIDDSFVLFFNGALCGASAPDHLHFQIGQKNRMPLQADGIESRHLYPIVESKQVNVYELQDFSRQAWIIKSTDVQASAFWLESICQAFAQIEGGKAKVGGKAQFAADPDFEAQDKINVVAWREKDMLTTIIFPRAAHRPSCYFTEDEEHRIVTSPASVEMMGYYILPRQEDFVKADAELLREIYTEVSLSPERTRAISEAITKEI